MPKEVITSYKIEDCNYFFLEEWYPGLPNDWDNFQEPIFIKRAEDEKHFIPAREGFTYKKLTLKEVEAGYDKEYWARWETPYRVKTLKNLETGKTYNVELGVVIDLNPNYKGHSNTQYTKCLQEYPDKWEITSHIDIQTGEKINGSPI